MNKFIPVDIPEGFEGPVTTPQFGDYGLLADGTWKQVRLPSDLTGCRFFIRRNAATMHDAKKLAAIRLANLYVRISGFRAVGIHPPGAVSSYLAEIIEIKNILESPE